MTSKDHDARTTPGETPPDPSITIWIDGREVPARSDQTILEAAQTAGIYIPRLCWLKDLSPFGSCRVCTVRADGRVITACNHPAADGLVVENDTEELRHHRRNLIDMLFIEGNHFCMFCEKSGACELQALAYRFGITAPRYPLRFPIRELDASHPEVLLDRNRCVLCARCVRASAEIDGKDALGFAGRGENRRLVPSSAEGLAGTAIAAGDAALAVCPTGSLLPKRRAFELPVGRRPYDEQPIGTEVESHGQG